MKWLIPFAALLVCSTGTRSADAGLFDFLHDDGDLAFGEIKRPHGEGADVADARTGGPQQIHEQKVPPSVSFRVGGFFSLQPVFINTSS